MFGNKLNSILSDMAKGNQTPEPEVEPTPEITQEVDELGNEEVLEPETHEEEIQEPEKQEVVEDVEQSENLDEIENWDDDIVDPEVEVVVQDEDYSLIGKDLGLSEVKSKNEFVTKIKEKINSLQKELESAKTNDNLPDNIPDSLKQAIEIAKNGGDFTAFLQLNSINYDAIPDVDLVANSVSNYFADEAGNIDGEGLDKYIDDMSNDQIRVEAAKIRDSIKRQREQEANSIAEQSRAKREQILTGMKKAIDGMSDINGFKPTESQKETMWKSFYKDTVIKDLFYNERGEFDYNKAAESVFHAKYGRKMNDFLKTKIRNQTKKDIINSMSFVEVQKPTSPAAPVITKVQESPMDRMINQLKGVKENK